MPNKKQQDPSWNPFYEKARAVLDSIGAFAAHPGQQSELAAQIAQQMWLEHVNAQRSLSPLDPNNRPGVPIDALPASAASAAGPLTKMSEQPQITF